jgi:septal ring factor EnvC (AmiA/AmiB activator)
MFDWFEKVLGVALGGILALFGWLIRNVFTNQKQIALLESSLKSQEKELEKLGEAVNRINDTQNMIGPVLMEQTSLLKEILHEKKL